MDTISLTPFGLFESAGPVGRAVMILLGLASVWCWVLIIEGIVSLDRLTKASHDFDTRPIRPSVLLAPVVGAGRDAAGLTLPGESPGERRHRLTEAMNRALRALLVQAEGRLPDLAVIASVAPFIGLFGTVWGIMTSFAGIAVARDTSLAVVAPGIAEALAATAYGLAAAIPASIGYTRLGTAFARLGGSLADRIEAHAVSLVAAEEPSR